MVADKCLNPGLDDQTANILITVSPSVPQKHSISKHDSPIISVVLIFLGGLLLVVEYGVGNVPVMLTDFKS